MADRTCSVDGCERTGKMRRGMCSMHYQRMKNFGTTDPPHPYTCTIDGCEAGGKIVRGMCATHYHRWRKYGDPHAGRPSPNPGAPCAIDDCTEPSLCRGWCNRHYLRWLNHGDPIAPGVPEAMRGHPLRERFEAKVDRNGPIPVRRPDLGPCHLWTAGTDGKGYGMVLADGRPRRAHRIAWLLAGLEFVDGLELDHLCNTRNCVNVAHMEQVTPEENTRRATEHMLWLRAHAPEPTPPSDPEGRCPP